MSRLPLLCLHVYLVSIQASFFIPCGLQGLALSPGLVGEALPPLHLPLPPSAPADHFFSSSFLFHTSQATSHWCVPLPFLHCMNVKPRSTLESCQQPSCHVSKVDKVLRLCHVYKVNKVPRGSLACKHHAAGEAPAVLGRAPCQHLQLFHWRWQAVPVPLQCCAAAPALLLPAYMSLQHV